MMKAHLSVFALSAILIASMGMAPAFGQTQGAIAVTTDKSSYSEGETILVTGEVKDLLSGFQVSAIIKAPNGNVVRVEQENVGSDKRFSFEHTAGGGLMKAKGTYIVEVQYGSEARTATTSFEFGGSTAVPDKTDIVNTINKKVSFEGTDDSITYEITGGKVLSITPDVDANSLVISIDATDDGSLTITIPKSILKSIMKDSMEDDEFFVLIDGQEGEFDETRTSTDRTLTIAFSAGAEEIEIVGTWVIPEFGTIAAMILAVAIISIIVVSAKSRLSIIPRY